MRRYMKFRIVLFACLLGAVVFVGRVGWAADAAAPAAGTPEATKPPGVNPFMIIFDNPLDFVFVIIVLCSVLGLTFIIQGFIKARASVLFPESSTDHIRELINQRQFKELIEFTETDPSFVSKALNPALKRAPSFAAMKEAMETAVGEQTAEQFRKIEYLNIIGNLGPLLGLLGTVLGMITAFENMKRSGGNANPKDLAGGISQALTHTMLGLLLALPCLSAFGVLRTMIDRLTVQGALISEELLLMVKPAEAKPAAAAAVAGVVRPGATPQPAAVMPPGPGVRKPPQPPVPNL
jgi:biopolymer transport protein ExbB